MEIDTHRIPLAARRTNSSDIKISCLSFSREIFGYKQKGESHDC